MSGIYVSDYGGGDSFFSQDFFYDGFSVKNDVFSLFYRFCKKLFPSKSIAAVNQKDAFAEIGQKESVFQGGISPADDRHAFAPEKGPVAGGAVGNSLSRQFLFSGTIQRAPLDAIGDDYGFAPIFSPLV